MKFFPACCVSLSVVDRRVMLKLLMKLGVSALALMLPALPVTACVLPGAAMTSAERECCNEDGGAVRGHGDGEVPSLLQGNPHTSGLSCSEGRLFASCAGAQRFDDGFRGWSLKELPSSPRLVRN